MAVSGPAPSVADMTDQTTDRSTARHSDPLPYFPAPSPAATTDPQHAKALLAPVLDALAGVVEVDDAALGRPTPCDRYAVAELRDHVLGWLQFFAAAMADPARTASRLDPDAYRAQDDSRPAADVVRTAAATLLGGIDAGALTGRVTVSQSQMDGPAVAAMALGEYLVHGWDLATALGRPWRPADDACEVAREFFGQIVAPEYRGGDGGFFGEEVAVPADAPALNRLLGFAGRDPAWTS